MEPASKRRGRPLPGAKSNIKPIIYNLEEALAVETLYRPNLLVIQQDEMPGEVTVKSRDAMVHLLRFLKVWFDVPEKVFFSAITYLDLFLERMKVQEKYLKCVGFACFYVAMVKEEMNIKAADFVAISQNNFSLTDILRMANIIREKVNVYTTNRKVVTCADLLKIYFRFIGHVGSVFKDVLDQKKLLTKLEVLLADSTCAFLRPSAMVFTLLRLEMDKKTGHTIKSLSATQLNEIFHVVTIMRQIQMTINAKSAELGNCSHHMSRVLARYNDNERITDNQYLKWKFRPAVFPSCKSTLTLPVIKERPYEPFRERAFHRERDVRRNRIIFRRDVI